MRNSRNFLWDWESRVGNWLWTPRTFPNFPNFLEFPEFRLRSSNDLWPSLLEAQEFVVPEIQEQLQDYRWDPAPNPGRNPKLRVLPIPFFLAFPTEPNRKCQTLGVWGDPSPVFLDFPTEPSALWGWGVCMERTSSRSWRGIPSGISGIFGIGSARWLSGSWGTSGTSCECWDSGIPNGIRGSRGIFGIGNGSRDWEWRSGIGKIGFGIGKKVGMGYLGLGKEHEPREFLESSLGFGKGS